MCWETFFTPDFLDFWLFVALTLCIPSSIISNILPFMSMGHKIVNISTTPQVFRTKSLNSASPIETLVLAFNSWF